jgi:hypothetical protein
MRLGESLIGQGLVTSEQVAAALECQRRAGGRLGAHLVAMGALTVEELIVALSAQTHGEAVLGLCERAVERCQSVYGANHPDTHRARYEYGRALLVAGRASDCAVQAEAAFLGHKTALGIHHSWTQESAHLLNNVRHVLLSAASLAPPEPAN